MLSNEEQSQVSNLLKLINIIVPEFGWTFGIEWILKQYVAPTQLQIADTCEDVSLTMNILVPQVIFVHIKDHAINAGQN